MRDDGHKAGLGKNVVSVMEDINLLGVEEHMPLNLKACGKQLLYCPSSPILNGKTWTLNENDKNQYTLFERLTILKLKRMYCIKCNLRVFLRKWNQQQGGLIVYNSCYFESMSDKIVKQSDNCN